MFRLKSLHQGRQADQVDQHVQKAHVYEGKGIESVHYPPNIQSARFLRTT